MPTTLTNRKSGVLWLVLSLSVLLLLGTLNCTLAFTAAANNNKDNNKSNNMTSSLQYIDKLALILIQSRRQLVARSKGKTAFFTPGGKREVGESDEQALRRECYEELTVQLIPSSIQQYGVFQAQAFGKPPGTMVRMTCYTADYHGTLQPSEEVEELAWIASDFPREQLTETGIMVLEDLKAKDLID